MSKKIYGTVVIVVLAMISAIAATVVMANNFGNKDNESNLLVNDTTSGYSEATENSVVKPTSQEYINTQPVATEMTEPVTMSVYSTATEATMTVNVATEVISIPVATEPVTVTATEYVPTEPPTEGSSEVVLENLIVNSGYSVDVINSLGIEQLMLVDAYGTQADIYMFSYNDGLWSSEKVECFGFVGNGGVGEKQSEDDNVTPSGLYSIGDAFYTAEQPATWLNVFRITENTYWVNDPESLMYNQKVEGEQNKDWNIAQHMIENPGYKYGCVINYNTDPIDKGKGSAIFVHCGTEATNGSVVLSEKDMLAYLEIMNSSKNPHILIF
ncbi:MAG: hypothetical protein UIM53_05145 [Acutalibacteraceae bacterium]|nr:hypothetical protein [Acutalibacteraceae bacterium]